jgi:hypothetical protein
MNGLVYALWIRLRFYQFRVQHALVIYTLLPVCIKTSNIYANAAQEARRNPGDPRSRPETRSSDVMVYDVYTGGNLASCSISKRGRPRMTSISSASFSALHSSVRYLLFFYTLLTKVYFVVSRRCMMQPIIFLLLIVVRFT